MPRYVYECTKCAHSYEKLEGWDAKPRQRCPKCRAVSQRMPASPAIVFKGSGWYSTDNRRSLREGADSLQQGEDAGESGSDSDSGSDSGSDSDSGDSGSGKQAAKSKAKSKSKSED